PQVRRQGRGRSVARLALVTPRATGESLKQAAGLGRGAGSWSSGYDIALTWRRSPVRIRSSPLPFRTHLRLSTATFGGRVHPRKLVLLRFSSIGDEGEIGGARDDEGARTAEESPRDARGRCVRHCHDNPRARAAGAADAPPGRLGAGARRSRVAVCDLLD